MSEQREIRLTSKEADMLLGLDSLPERLRRIVEGLRKESAGNVTFRVDAVEAEEIGLDLTLRLAGVGFDDHYELTSEGELIEGLIERFRFN